MGMVCAGLYDNHKGLASPVTTTVSGRSWVPPNRKRTASISDTVLMHAAALLLWKRWRQSAAPPGTYAKPPP